MTDMDKLARFQMTVLFLTKNAKLAKSQKELGKMLGYNNQSYFSQLCNGFVPIPEAMGIKIKNIYPSFSIPWFETGEGEMTEKPNDNTNTNTNTNNNTQTVTIGSPNVEHADILNIIAESQRQSAEVLRQTAKMQEMMMAMISKM